MPEPEAIAFPLTLTDVGEVVAATHLSGTAGAIWRLAVPQRDLDANIIHLCPGNAITAHDGPEIDVLVLVLRGSARIATDTDGFDAPAGSLVWLPRRSRRGFTAGPDGVSYLTVHQRRQALVLGDVRSDGGGC
ncbi:MAG: hypothetical protein ACT4PP_14610 [Sporichthyaceae bacterium]